MSKCRPRYVEARREGVNSIPPVSAADKQGNGKIVGGES